MVEVPGYVVGAELGRGGFGVVHRARDTRTGAEVAVKVLQASAGAEQQRQFEAERRTVASLPLHPGLPRILASGRAADGAPYVVTPLLPGGSLADRLPLAASTAVDLCARLADTLQVAHDAGIVHRDVKPANVLLDAAGAPVLVDFGIASRAGDGTVSANDDVAVSIGFAAPEVLAGAAADASADVYAVGATLFCLLTGHPPFVPLTGSEPVAVVAARIARDPVDDLRPAGVPDAVCRVIERAMAKRPAARYPSAAELAVALRDAGRAVDPSPVARVRRAVLAPRRAPFAAVAAAVVLFGGVVTAVAVTGTGESSPDGGSRAAGQAASLGAQASPADAVGGATGGGSAEPGATDAAAGGAAAAGVPGLPAADAAGGRSTAAGRPSTGGGHATSPGRAVPGRTAPGRPVVLHPAPSRTTTHAPPPNHAPTVSAHGGTFDEHAVLHLTVSTADADGDHVSLAAKNLPWWLHLSGGALTGTISYKASHATTSDSNIRSTPYTITLTATDSHGASSSTSITLHVRDTLRTMPNYIGKTGKAAPSIYAVSTVTRSCAYQRSGDGTRIYWQSVRPGTVIHWGRKITYLYGRNRTSCRHVSGHYPS